MSLKVLRQLLGGMYQGQHSFLQGQVSHLGINQSLADVIHELLHSLVPQQHSAHGMFGHRKIHKHILPWLGGCQHECLHQIIFQISEGYIAFFIPLEPPPLLQKLVKWSATINKLGDESVKCGQHPSQFLNFFRIARWIKAPHGIDLIGVNLYPPVSDQVTQEFANPYTEDALLGIKAQLVLPKYFKCSL